MGRWVLHLHDQHKSLKLLFCHHLSDGYSNEFFYISLVVAEAQSKIDLVSNSIKMQIS